MRIDQSIRDILPSHSLDFDQLENHHGQLQERFFARTISRTHEGRPLGANSINFLLSVLVRANSLLDGLGTAMNNHNVLPAFLIVRAHYEVTGALAFFLRQLRQFKKHVHSEDEFKNILRRMTLGMRRLPDENDPRRSRVPTIDNVLNYVDETDRFMKENFPKLKKQSLRTNYDFLSEFCHPNAFGLMLGRTINKRTIAYERIPFFSAKHLRTILSHILPSSLLFLILFDETWKIVTENFDLPELRR